MESDKRRERERARGARRESSCKLKSFHPFGLYIYSKEFRCGFKLNVKYATNVCLGLIKPRTQSTAI
ncbi:uncharacterized protein LOC110184391 isoform X2 [Drosophila serrata]|uniref:uncharacterized protein LOC110184391 isoform X2 n=1 Tax=Drosophila serrata TaxID=7274 RepID=UPI000A1D0071|nr:uncharacterized protein LOC110184391 isoform X2 [Drosophila serrata]